MPKEKLENAVTIEYHTRQGYCHCCGQKLETPNVSDIRRFTLTKDNFFEWSDEWEEIAKYDDLQDVVEEFIYDTISFYSANSHETIIVAENQIYKAKNFVLSDVVNN